MSEKKIAVRFTKYVDKPALKKMSYDDRLEFIDWLFDNYEIFDFSKSVYNVSKHITETYREETHMKLSLEWVVGLIKYGIVKYEDGSYGFEKSIPYTLNELCEHPKLVRQIN